jgi:hypothetical protein
MMTFMRAAMRKYLLPAVLAIAGSGLPAAPAWAASGSDREVVDARLEGYTPDVTMQGTGTATIWFIAVGLGILCFGVMFKNAKRTHLD